MKVTGKMKVKEVLALGDQMLEAFCELAPAFQRLRRPTLRRAMAGRINVEQAARIGGVSLAEALYVLNLAAGYDAFRLAEELYALSPDGHEYTNPDPTKKPLEIAGIKDDDRLVTFVDVLDHAKDDKDPLADITRGLASLQTNSDVLLIRHPFDPIPLRDLFGSRGYCSWAEERGPNEWFIYFFRPNADVGSGNKNTASDSGQNILRSKL